MGAGAWGVEACREETPFASPAGCVGCPVLLPRPPALSALPPTSCQSRRRRATVSLVGSKRGVELALSARIAAAAADPRRRRLSDLRADTSAIRARRLARRLAVHGLRPVARPLEPSDHAPLEGVDLARAPQLHDRATVRPSLLLLLEPLRRARPGPLRGSRSLQQQHTDLPAAETRDRAGRMPAPRVKGQGGLPSTVTSAAGGGMVRPLSSAGWNDTGGG